MQPQTPLITALFQGKIPAIKELLSQGHDPNQKDSEGVTPLIHAADICPELVKVLIQHGADVNYRCPTNGYTPLAIAQLNGDVESEALLREAGAVEV